MSSDPIGEMRERITIQYPTKVADGLGSFTETWVDGFICWAKAWTVSSSESTANMQVNMIRVQKFKIYYRRVFSPSWRLKFGNRYFNITSIDPDQDRQFLYLTCKEVV
jgi:SPP1 family predicted phage head-tail adaptor